LIFNDYTNKAVLITGGTAGIGLATGLAFGRVGAQVYLTHRWGSEDNEEIKNQFKERGFIEPVIIEADASNKEDTQSLVETIAKNHPSIETFISNVAFGHVSKRPTDLERRSLLATLKYNAWPVLDYLKEIKRVTGKFPRYVIGMSSRGPETYLQGYDFIAASKAALESICKRLTALLIKEDIRINVLCPNTILTKSFEATFDPEFKYHLENSLGKYGNYFVIKPDKVANVAVALCGGGMDAIKGQVLNLDQGACFSENLNMVYKYFTKDDKS